MHTTRYGGGGLQAAPLWSAKPADDEAEKKIFIFLTTPIKTMYLHDGI